MIILVTCNGAVARDSISGAVLWEEVVSEDLVRRVIEFCREEKPDFRAYIGDQILISDFPGSWE